MRTPHGVGVGRTPVHKGKDLRVGLNITYRGLASILKYDHLISPVRGPKDELEKGYYYFDEDLVSTIRSKVLGADVTSAAQLRTIECSIMDTADDIAYSTYDLEDALKSGLLTPLQLWVLTADEELMGDIAKKVDRRIKMFYGDQPKSFDDKDAMTAIKPAVSALFQSSQRIGRRARI